MCDLLLIKMRFVKKTGKKTEKNENEFQILEMASFFLLSWTPPPPPPLFYIIYVPFKNCSKIVQYVKSDLCHVFNILYVFREEYLNGRRFSGGVVIVTK